MSTGKKMQEKVARLETLLRQMGRVAVAFSGGVDSTLLLALAHDVLDDGVLALTAVSPSLPADARTEAEALARQIGAHHVLIETDELEDEHYAANPADRCYFCRAIVLDRLIAYAAAQGYPVLVDGNNADDAGDFRPGRKAARELGVRSPLLEIGLNKAEIRALARERGLPNWDAPSAACLSSRIPYGTRVSAEVLWQVERAERALHSMGFRQVRVRHHGQVARIEVAPDDFAALLGSRELVVAALRDAGYTYVALDLAGFRSGSLNEALQGGHQRIRERISE